MLTGGFRREGDVVLGILNGCFCLRGMGGIQGWIGSSMGSDEVHFNEGWTDEGTYVCPLWSQYC